MKKKDTLKNHGIYNNKNGGGGGEQLFFQNVTLMY